MVILAGLAQLHIRASASDQTGGWTSGESSRHHKVKHRKRTPGSKPSGLKAPPPLQAAEQGGSAFDVWLERGLHKLFDEVASEPIPPELLQLIEGDRSRPAVEELKSEEPCSEAD